MSETDELAGVFEVIDSNSTAHDPVEEVSTTAQAEGGESEAAATETTASEAQATGTTDEGATQQTETTETDVPLKTETQASETSQEDKTKTETETQTEQDFSEWKNALPPSPGDYQGKAPDFDENGRVTNMDAQEYLDYTINVAEHRLDVKNYTNLAEARALDVAEQIIPDIKTNPNVRKLVQNTRLASILNGQPIDTVQAALEVRELLGIAPERIQAAKTEGANSAKASVTIQKAAALETGSTSVPDTNADKEIDLVKRVRRGDSNAFTDLLGEWEQRGLIK